MWLNLFSFIPLHSIQQNEGTLLRRAGRRDLRVCQFYALSSGAAVRVSQTVAGNHKLIISRVRQHFPMRR